MQTLKSSWQSLRIPNHTADKAMFSAFIDSEVHNRFNEASKKFGWGGKRRLLEAAIVKILDETDFEQ